jgi:hypothetical protein
MTLYELLSLIGAGIAIIISIVAIAKSNATNMATVEILINERITATKEKVMDVTTTLAPYNVRQKNGTLSEDDKGILEIYEKQFNTAVENNLNAYENACAKYIDKKVDRVRFKKEYYAEIRALVEKECYKQYFDPTTSKFKAILKLYKEWCDLER